MDVINTKEQFAELVNSIEANPAYPGRPAAFALGLATIYGTELLDLRFPHTNVCENFGSAAAFWWAVNTTDPKSPDNELDQGDLDELLYSTFAAFEVSAKAHPNLDAIERLGWALEREPMQGGTYRFGVVLAWVQDFDTPPANRADAWLRLTLLSQTKCRPNSMNLDGIFGLLPNLAWTDVGPVVPTSAWDIFDASAAAMRSLDKFPPMLDYVIPKGVRVADASRVRLGAHLAEGTTVMHEGFVNFNAGTLGASMVEGRISAGVTVDDGSDIGGGASIMGTLSGGGKEKITVGKGCLLGANSGIGISLGDNCVVEAGLYVTAGTKVYCLLDRFSGEFKARELSGASNLLFRRNSRTGMVEAVERRVGSTAVLLNEALHQNSATLTKADPTTSD